MRTLAILIPTTKPDFLVSRILPVLDSQARLLNLTGEWTVAIFICLNGSGFSGPFNPPRGETELKVLRTEEAGFSIPRNILWQEAASCDYVIYLDDDQVPEENYLRLFTDLVYPNTPFVLYFGGVEYRVAGENSSTNEILPESRPELSGEIVEPYWGGIGNTLIKRSELNHIRLPFHPDFNWGGEDTLFLLQLRGEKFRSYSYPKARVIEYWNPNRLTVSAHLNRKKRQIDAYYKIRLFQKRHKRTYDKNFIKIYCRVVFLPFVLLLQMINRIYAVLFPGRVTAKMSAIQLGKIRFVMLSPWTALLKNRLSSGLSQ